MLSAHRHIVTTGKANDIPQDVVCQCCLPRTFIDYSNEAFRWGRCATHAFPGPVVLGSWWKDRSIANRAGWFEATFKSCPPFSKEGTTMHVCGCVDVYFSSLMLSIVEEKLKFIPSLRKGRMMQTSEGQPHQQDKCVS